MRFVPSLFLVLCVGGCGVPEVDEPEVASSQDALLGSIVAPGDTRCAAQKVSEQATDYNSGPYLFVSCSDHPINVFEGQTITLTQRDPFTGAISRLVLPDTTQTSSAGTLMLEMTCAKNIFYQCPCGIGFESVSGTVFRAAFCKSQPANTLP